MNAPTIAEQIGTSESIKPRSRVAAVVTAYKPDAMFVARLENTSLQVEHLFVVDNTPGGMASNSENLPVNMTVIADGTNRGLAVALNAGIEEATRRGAEFVLLLDQDSTPPKDFVDDLLAGYWRVTERAKVAVVAPLMIDERTGIPDVPKLEPRRMVNTGIYDWPSLPTSGMLIPVEVYHEIGQFDTDLFLDFVDFEWCWRARSKGYLTCRVNKARLSHNLGFATRKLLMFTYCVPAPFRHYFQFRDTLNLALRPYAPVFQRLRMLCLIVAKCLVYPVILDSGLVRFKWMYLGVRDFVLKIKGVGSAECLLERDQV